MCALHWNTFNRAFLRNSSYRIGLKGILVSWHLLPPSSRSLLLPRGKNRIIQNAVLPHPTTIHSRTLWPLHSSPWEAQISCKAHHGVCVLGILYDGIEQRMPVAFPNPSSQARLVFRPEKERKLVQPHDILETVLPPRPVITNVSTTRHKIQLPWLQLFLFSLLAHVSYVTKMINMDDRFKDTWPSQGIQKAADNSRLPSPYPLFESFLIVVRWQIWLLLSHCKFSVSQILDILNPWWKLNQCLNCGGYRLL